MPLGLALVALTIVSIAGNLFVLGGMIVAVGHFILDGTVRYITLALGYGLMVGYFVWLAV